MKRKLKFVLLFIYPYLSGLRKLYFLFSKQPTEFSQGYIYCVPRCLLTVNERAFNSRKPSFRNEKVTTCRQFLGALYIYYS